MNRWEYIYTDVNRQYLQHRQERTQCLSPVSLSCTYTHTFKSSSTCRQWHTHTDTFTHRVCGIKIEWTVWEHGAQQASLVSYFRQDFQWSKHITGHHSESRDRTRTGRAVGKHQNLFYFLQISHLLMSQRTVDHNIPCIFFYFSLLVPTTPKSPSQQRINESCLCRSHGNGIQAATYTQSTWMAKQ